METFPASSLKKGDRVKFTGAEYEMQNNPQLHPTEHGLLILSFSGPLGSMTLPGSVELPVAYMPRVVEVLCAVHRGHVRTMVDLATQTVPFAVLCGDCDEKTTAEVMAQMAARDEPVEDNTGEVPFSDYVPPKEG